MKVSKRSLRVSLLCAVTTVSALVGLPAESAHANTNWFGPTGSYTIGRGYGPVPRATFAENNNGTGKLIEVYGSSNCTTRTSDVETYANSLYSNWNDNISWAKDEHACDVVFFKNINRSGASQYRDFSYEGGSLDGDWNDEISSFYLT